MLVMLIGGEEVFDEATNEFSVVNGFELEMEHSLLSLSKWESKFQKPFLDGKPKTSDELFGYFEAMTLNPIYPQTIWSSFNQANVDTISEYIDSKQSATTFREVENRKTPVETVTSELIYYWMVAFNIPFECQHWHLNRLFTLIRICNLKQQQQNKKPQKMTQADLQRRRELNERRRAELGTRG